MVASWTGIPVTRMLEGEREKLVQMEARLGVRLINRGKGVLVDVSEPAEFAAGHAAGARNVPLGALDGTKELPSNKALPLLLICPTGARAGVTAVRIINGRNLAPFLDQQVQPDGMTKRNRLGGLQKFKLVGRGNRHVGAPRG